MSRGFGTEDLVRLLRLGLNQREAAEALGVKHPAVNRRIRIEGIPYASYGVHRNARAAALKAEAAQGDRSCASSPTPDALAATGGRYRDLCDYAAQRGLSYTQALQRWHRLGLAAKPRRD